MLTFTGKFTTIEDPVVLIALSASSEGLPSEKGNCPPRRRTRAAAVTCPIGGMARHPIAVVIVRGRVGTIDL